MPCMNDGRDMMALQRSLPVAFGPEEASDFCHLFRQQSFGVIGKFIERISTSLANEIVVCDPQCNPCHQISVSGLRPMSATSPSGASEAIPVVKPHRALEVASRIESLSEHWKSHRALRFSPSIGSCIAH